MCLLCAEIQLQKIKPSDFWRNFREATDEHQEEILKEVLKTDIEYQTELSNEALRES